MNEKRFVMGTSKNISEFELIPILDNKTADILTSYKCCELLNQLDSDVKYCNDLLRRIESAVRLNENNDMTVQEIKYILGVL